MTEIIGWISFALGAIFSAIDAILTGMILARGGREKNLVLRWFMDKIGITAGLGIPKIISAGICAWAVHVGFWPAGVIMAIAFGYISKRNFEILSRYL